MSNELSLNGKICLRITLLALFIEHNADYGLSNQTPTMIKSGFQFALNSSRNIVKNIRLAYTPLGARGSTDLISEDRLRDISLMIDELSNADNIEELIELVKQHKVVNVTLNN